MNNCFKSLLSIGLLLFSMQFFGATISGVIVDQYGGLDHIVIKLAPSQQAVYSDSLGYFILKEIPIGEHVIQIKSLGYQLYSKKVTISEELESLNLGDIFLKEMVLELDSIVLNTGTATDYNIFDSPVKVEVINQEYFTEVESYNLVEGIQSVAGVEEVVSCGVCGTNDIHINGMEGRYTLILIDGMPVVSSLASVYGLNGIPTSMIERIEIIKGPASAVYGSEAMGGVINVITTKPDNAPKFLASTSLSSHLENNTSVALNKKISKQTSGLISANYFTNHYRLDKNNDNFTDFALGDKVSIFGKLERIDSVTNKAFRLSGRYYFEDRYGGVMDWEKSDRASESVYGESILTNRIELVSHYDLPVDKNVFLDVSYAHHDQNSYYGNVSFIAIESVLNTMLTWNQGWRNHDITSGLSLRLNNYNDNTPATSTQINQWIPGVFVQDLYEVHENLSLLPGVRFDYQNEHGIIFSPRVSAKYDLGDWTNIRFSSGKGFKVVNLFTEDHAAISGTREVVIEEEIEPEESYNLNLTLDHVISIGKKGTGKITVDAFYNYFTNQIIPDYDTDATKIIYDNLDFRSEAKGLATTLNYFQGKFSVEGNLIVQRVNEILQEEGGVVRESQPFTPNFTSNLRLRYEFPKIYSKLVTNVKIVGPQRLPKYEEPFSRPTESTTFAQVGMRFSKTFKKNLTWGVGVKNLFNYTQDSPLINPEQPYSDTFDTAYAYGPLQTRRFYISLNYEFR